MMPTGLGTNVVNFEVVENSRKQNGSRSGLVMPSLNIQGADDIGGADLAALINGPPTTALGLRL
jgi:hypothetical protein